MLWKEFDCGINGRKPSRFFTPEDRAANKDLYTLRNHFWMAMALLLERGMTVKNALSRISQTYKGMTPMKVCMEMRTDRAKKVFRFLDEPKDTLHNYFGKSKWDGIVEAEKTVEIPTKMFAPSKVALHDWHLA